ncbi:MAG: thiol:disulfide interchange protein DsbA/DsbL [Gammaproteobacteria bacterium]|jgi:thiol:disulfide interchange protein DsbA
MKRLLLAMMAVSAFAFGGLALAADNLQAGTDYEAVDPPQPTNVASGQIEVIEFFSYACPHCYAFEPYLEDWSKSRPDNVVLTRIPAVFNGGEWEVTAQSYYTEQALGTMDKTHQALFDYIHKDHKPMRTKADAAAFFEQHGVSEKEFSQAWDSFSVDSDMRRAAAMAKRYQITGVPTMVVNGKYRVDAEMAHNFPNLLKTVSALVAREQAAAK